MSHKKAQLIVALDIDSMGELRAMMDQLGGLVDIFKVGSQLFTACGPAAVRFIQARGKKVFLDLKFHDIPNTVARAVSIAVELSAALDRSMAPMGPQRVKNENLFMYTVHTCGGLDMMKAAVEAATKKAAQLGFPKPLGVGVTVLTSEEKKDNIQALVLERARLAQQSGLDGVVASCHEAPMLRKEFNDKFIIVTPGIRPSDSDVQDQKRVSTPRDAVLSGSDFLVVGRPIVEAPDPLKAAQAILKDINDAQK